MYYTIKRKYAFTPSSGAVIQIVSLTHMHRPLPLRLLLAVTKLGSREGESIAICSNVESQALQRDEARPWFCVAWFYNPVVLYTNRSGALGVCCAVLSELLTSSHTPTTWALHAYSGAQFL